MKSTNILEIDEYKEILYRIINIFHDFEVALQDGVLNDEVRYFMMEDLSDDYETFQDIQADIEKVSIPKKPFSNKQQFFVDKMIAFLYSNLINFCRTKKVKGILISKKFISNIDAILRNTSITHNWQYSQSFTYILKQKNY